MWTYLRCELMKTRRTPIWLIVFAAPLIVALVAVLMAIKQHEPRGLLSNALGLWVVLVSPMACAAMTAYLAQIEHAPNAFEHLFALPMRRFRLFLAKAVVAILLQVLMTAWLIGAALALGTACFGMAPMRTDTAVLMQGVTLVGAGLALVVLHLWLALRLRSFLVPLVVGILGSFFAGAALGSWYSALLPWGAPMAILAAGGKLAPLGLVAGSLGGVLGLMLMLYDLRHAELMK